MKKIIFFTLLSIFLTSCGGESSGSSIVNITENNNEDLVPNDNEAFLLIDMELNRTYEISPGDIYIPNNEYTKVKIEYQPLLDKQFISILSGQAIFKKKKE
ncbi:MAG TPA: hypothetical protein ENK79_02210 [Campylobacterales bacterium]|nr:hypothetical protein [Campylobacterales bacterium]